MLYKVFYGLCMFLNNLCSVSSFGVFEWKTAKVKPVFVHEQVIGYRKNLPPQVELSKLYSCRSCALFLLLWRYCHIFNKILEGSKILIVWKTFLRNKKKNNYCYLVSSQYQSHLFHICISGPLYNIYFWKLSYYYAGIK